MRKAAADANSVADERLEEELGIDDVNARLTCRHRCPRCGRGAAVGVPCVCVLICFDFGYLGVVDEEEAPAEMRGKKNHNKMVRFEWVLGGFGSDKKAQVVVRNNNVKERKVPLPERWTKITAARVHKECEHAPAEALRHWPSECQDKMPTVVCKRPP